MKKLVLIFILLLFPIRVYSLSASSVTVMDMDTKRVLYSYNQNEVRLIASISKIMTSLVTLNNSNIKDIVTIDESVLKSYGSGIYVEVGEEMSLENLLYGLMLRSGNDAAIQIANYVGGSMEGFVELMNETAKSIGMKKTTFINSSGLENNNGVGNMSTSYDMALLMSEAMKNSKFKEIVNTQKRLVKTNYKTYLWHNKNKLLKSYQYCTGGKTGFTEKARRTLVTTASKDNMNLVVVTLNDPNDFKDHEELYNKYFKEYKNYKVLDKDNEKFNNKNFYIKSDIFLTLTSNEYKKINKEVVLYKDNVSDIVGYVMVKLDEDVLIKEYIYIRDKIKIDNKKEKVSFFDKIKNFLGIS